MSQQPANFNTSYVGAHRWALTARGGYDWVCTCGDKGHIASHGLVFVMECFAQHAHRKLEKAAVALLEEGFDGKDTWHLQGRVGWLREHQDNDEANLLQMVINNREDNEGRRD